MISVMVHAGPQQQSLRVCAEDGPKVVVASRNLRHRPLNWRQFARLHQAGQFYLYRLPAKRRWCSGLLQRASAKLFPIGPTPMAGLRAILVAYQATNFHSRSLVTVEAAAPGRAGVIQLCTPEACSCMRLRDFVGRLIGRTEVVHLGAEVASRNPDCLGT